MLNTSQPDSRPERTRTARGNSHPRRTIASVAQRAGVRPFSHQMMVYIELIRAQFVKLGTGNELGDAEPVRDRIGIFVSKRYADR
jgi:hypothetical protein